MKYIFTLLIFTFMSGTSYTQNSTDIYTHKIGQIDISLLSENQGQGSKKILIADNPKILEQIIPDGTFPNAVNTFLIRSEDKHILVDTGFGTKLFDNLAILGIHPEKIDVVLLTHMHGDHIGGMFKDGEKAFPNAKIYIAKAEYKYWSSEKKENDLAIKIFTQYKEQLVLFEPTDFDTKQTLLPGIKAIKAYGHTPGHTIFLVGSDKEKLLIWGDITHAQAVQIPFPEVAVIYDVDPTQAVASRIATLKYVIENNIPIAGMHIPYPGMGRITMNDVSVHCYTPINSR